MRRDLLGKIACHRDRSGISALRATNDRSRHSAPVEAGKSAKRRASSSNLAGRSGFEQQGTESRRLQLQRELSIMFSRLPLRPAHTAEAARAGVVHSGCVVHANAANGPARITGSAVVSPDSR